MADRQVGSSGSRRGERVGELALALLETQANYLIARTGMTGTEAVGEQSRHRVDAHTAVILSYLASLGDYTPSPGMVSRDELAATAIQLLARSEPGRLFPETHHPPIIERPNGFHTGYLGLSVLLLADALPPDVADHVREGCAEAADWYLNWRPPSGLYYDTKSEETAWEVFSPAVAQALCPEHPHARFWYEKAREMTLNSYSRECDNEDTQTRFDGIPLADLVHTANIFPDFTMHNHQGFNTCYQVCNNNLAPPYFVYKRYLGGVPEWFTWNWEGMHAVTKRLVLRDGHLLWPGGCDYWPYTHVGFCHYHALMAEALGCGVSLWCLEKALGRALEEQQGNPDGSLYGRRIPHMPLGWQTNFAAFIVSAHLFAPYAGVPELSDEEVAAATQGTLVSDDADLAVRNGPDFASCFCWNPVYGKGQAFGCVLPSDDIAWTDAWCSIPNLVGTVRLAPGHERDIVPDDPSGYINHHRRRLCDPGELPGNRRRHLQGGDGEVVWSLGQLLDDEGDVLHVVGMIAGPGATLHLERFVRFGDKTRVGGVETLNYMMGNDPVDRDGILLEWEGAGERVAAENRHRDVLGDMLLLDRKLALIRAYGDTRLHGEQKRGAPEPCHTSPRSPWRLRIWGEPSDGEVPEAYAVLAEQVTLFAPAGSLDEASEVRRSISIEPLSTGRLQIHVALPHWDKTYRVDWGTSIAISLVGKAECD